MTRKDIRAALTREDESILFEGANLSQLGILFKVDHRVLKEKMHGIRPVGKRYNAEIYDIAEVATRMGKLTDEQVDAAMKRLNHADLPKMLSKEYWAGQRSKQEFLLKEGDLWPTGKVVEEVGEMVKQLKMELDLLSDGVERQVELSDRQREIVKQLVNGAKMNMLLRLKEKFETKQPVVESTPEIKVLEDDDEL